jgi:hypothetical protein
MPILTRRRCLTAAAVPALALAGCVVAAPPPPAPVATAVWEPGHFDREGVWIPGHWRGGNGRYGPPPEPVEAPRGYREGRQWVPGHYDNGAWYPGHWVN